MSEIDSGPPPGFVRHSMKLRDALASSDPQVRGIAQAALREGAAQAAIDARDAYIAAALDQPITFDRARMN